MEFLAIEHALFVLARAEVDLLRAADDAAELEDVAVGLGGSEHVLAAVAEVESEDVGHAPVLARHELALVVAQHDLDQSIIDALNNISSKEGCISMGKPHFAVSFYKVVSD